MRSSSIFTSLSSALVITLLSSFAATQTPPPPQPQPPPPGAAPPGAPWPPQPGAPAPGAPAPGSPQPAPAQPAPGPAQPGTPPTPAPGPAPAPGTPGAPPPEVPGQNPYYGPPTGAQPGASPYGASAGASGSAAFDTRQGAVADVTSSEETPEDRVRSLQEHNSIFGGTGLLRTLSAGSGSAGTFRLHLLMDWFQTSSFLCYDSNRCHIPGTPDSSPDSATHFGANVGLSVTPIEFLEAYATIRSASNFNDRGRPKLLQVLGDTTLGIKAFTPNKLGQTFNFGGAADLLFLNGAGGVGIDSGSTSFRLKALATLDFRQPNDGGLPLRLHLNLGYQFDNSGSLVEDIENQRRLVNDQRGPKITRVERFGLGINRVDQFLISIGAEGTLSAIRPFVEWHLGIASNRQGYECDPNRGQALYDDFCLANADFSGMPSTLTLGLRAYPFLKGFEALLAFDIGTTGTSYFIEELAPTAQWDLWLGLGYAFDVQEPPAPKPQIVERVVGAAPVPERIIRGFVHEKDKPDGVPNAIVRFEGRTMSGLVTGPDGRFVSGNVEPGNYTLSIHADSYKDGQCSLVVPAASAAGPAPGAPGPMPPPGAPPAPGAPPPPGAPAYGAGAGAPPAGPSYVDVDCPLEANPRTGSLTGTAVDADSKAAVAGVSIKVVDTQGKEMGIAVDANGAFKMEGLQPGTITIKAEADGYMLHVEQAEVRAREATRADLQLHKRPKKGDVEIAGNEIKIKRQVHFETDSAKISLDSTALLEEIADTINRNACLHLVEIQGHTDNTGTKDHNKTLSEQRANSVREWLLAHGVESGRLTAQGYGQERPISPNVTPAGKERNRRVQFIIKQQDKGCGKGGGAKGGEKPAGEPKPAGEKKPKPAMPF